MGSKSHALKAENTISTHYTDENGINRVNINTDMTEEEYVAYRAAIQKEQEEKATKLYKGAQMKEECKPYGTFVWVLYKVGKMLFEGRISDATLTRFMYLSTFTRYRNPKDKKDDRKRKVRINGVDMYGLITDNKVAITKSLAEKILRVSAKTLNAFLEECVTADMMYVDKEGKLYVSTKFIMCGEYSNSGISDTTDSMRLYCDTVRELYIKTKPNKLATLSYLFLMIPYLNKEWNVLCYNQYEENLDNVKMMTLNDYCGIIGYGKHNAARFSKKLTSIVVGNEYAISVNSFGNNTFVFVNPRIFYAGRNHEKVLEYAKISCPEDYANDTNSDE